MSASRDSNEKKRGGGGNERRCECTHGENFMVKIRREEKSSWDRPPSRKCIVFVELTHHDAINELR